MGTLRLNDAHQQAASLLSGGSQTSCDTGVSLRGTPMRAIRIPLPLGLCTVTTDLVPGKDFRYSDCHGETRYPADQAHDPASPSTASSRGREFEGRASPFGTSLFDSMLPLPDNVGVLSPLQTSASRPGWQQDRQKSRARKSNRGSSPDHKRARAAMSVDMSSCTWDGAEASLNDENVFMLPPSPRDEAASRVGTPSKYRDESPPPDRMIQPLSSPPPVRRAPVRSLSPLPDNSRWMRRLPDLFNSPDERQILHPAGVPPDLPPVEPLHPIDATSAVLEETFIFADGRVHLKARKERQILKSVVLIADGKQLLRINSANIPARTPDPAVALRQLQTAAAQGATGRHTRC